MRSILITGGLGFIGSHICIELLEKDYDIIIVDNLKNSTIDVLDKIKFISKKSNIKFYKKDLRIKEEIIGIFKNENISDIIHCAGYKSVNESIDNPLTYYRDNLTMTFNLLDIISIYNIKRFIFSSSATVYGSNNDNKYFDENDIVGQNITNPYGQTKYMQEIIIKDFANKYKNIEFIILRYFNPVGCHPSGLIGENPLDIPNNLMPYLLRVICNNNNLGFQQDKYSELTIYGDDYNTDDGTCIRDFIHVVDLALAHIKCLTFNSKGNQNYNIFNIGTGKGTSVLQMVKEFNKHVQFKYKIGKRRNGDPSIVICNVNKAIEKLEWKCKFGINDIVNDSLKYIYI